MSIYDLLVQMVVGIPLTAWVIRRDMRRLDPVRYARSWNTASFWSAVVGFGPLSILVHFIRTRRNLWGAVLGLLWAAGVVVALGVAGQVLETVLER